MNRKILALSMGLLAFWGAQGAARHASAAAPGGEPPRLEHTSYVSARKVILGYGWAPLGGPCEGVSARACASFPEIGSCSGDEGGYCGMVFVRQDRCLYVTTSGGEPESGKDSDTTVEKVTFRHGPCAK